MTNTVSTQRSAVARLGVFVAVLVVIAAAGFGLGWVVNDGDTSNSRTQMGADGHSGDRAASSQAATASAISGFASAQHGYRIVAESTTFTPGVQSEFRFQIRDRNNRPVADFPMVQEKRLHLVVVRRDLSGYQHLHPQRVDDTWRVPLTLPAAGSWRAVADFVVEKGDKQVPLKLGVDLNAPGDYQPRMLPDPSLEAHVDDLTVRLGGDPKVGKQNQLQFTVLRDGQSVASLERYLGSYGHLVVLRDGDLGYVHAHSENQLKDGAIAFTFAAPSSGRYRAFFDFQLGGQVRTAEFTLNVQ